MKEKPTKAPTAKKPAPHYLGHRKRLRERFIRGGAEALQEYELLELILFRAIPRRDVKALAKRLIAEFGDLSGVLGAPEQQLRADPEISEHVCAELKLVEAAALHLGQSRIMHKPIIAAWSDVISYFRAKLAEKKVEEFHVLFLDKKNRIIADEVMGQGTVDHTPVYPREVMKRALELSASAMVIVHNHPSGDPAPSRTDMEMTAQLKELAAEFNINLHDHLVIGRNDEVSFKDLGIL